jgi:hypothetical protein
VLTAYVGAAETLRLEALFAAAFAACRLARGLVA